jgi:hypothetical protein
METYGVSDFFREEQKRLTDQIDREAWKFEQIKGPDRGRLKVAAFRQRFRR